MLTLRSLSITDDPEVWGDLGFSVVDSCVRIGSVDVHLIGRPANDGGPAGIVAWTFATDSGSLPSTVDGIPVVAETRGVPGQNPSTWRGVAHANGIVRIDHIVVSTPSIDRTVEAFESVGLECRRQRERTYGSGEGATTMRQAFFWLGGADAAPEDRVLCEVVGPKVVDERRVNDPTTFFGLALTSDDLDATVASMGGLIKPAITAAQAGRRIATVRSSAGSSVPIAVMSPHVDPADVEQNPPSSNEK